jgi:muramoyltetrapeptide carboxypeptidase
MKKCSVVSTSYISSEKEIEKIVENMKRLGFEEVLVYSSKQNFLGKWAGTPSERLNMFYEAWNDDGDVVIASRGGSGVSHFVSKIDVNKLEGKKMFVGYSDLTLLLNFLNQKLKIVSLHGPMALKELDPLSLSCLRRALSMCDYSVSFSREEVCFSGEEKISGEIVAGNLDRLVESLLYYNIDFSDKILFLEEVGLTEYKVLNLLYNLSAYKNFSPKIIIFGGLGAGFTGKFREAVGDIFPSIPLIFDFPFGHRVPNITVPIGANCTVDFRERKFFFSFDGVDKSYAVCGLG